MLDVPTTNRDLSKFMIYWLYRYCPAHVAVNSRSGPRCLSLAYTRMKFDVLTTPGLIALVTVAAPLLKGDN